MRASVSAVSSRQGPP
ncbi:hypothetical protein YPPY15_0383, partial [Yersinia pestis PY-15]